MKKVYLVYSKLKSNHRRIVAAFESENLAKIYLKHRRTKDAHEFKSFEMESVNLMDDSPEFVKLVLS